MKELKNVKEMVPAKMMLNSNGICFNDLESSLCKCQNCNKAALKTKALTKSEIKQLFNELAP